MIKTNIVKTSEINTVHVECFTFQNQYYFYRIKGFYNHIDKVPSGANNDLVCEECANCYPFLQAYRNEITPNIDENFCFIKGKEYLPIHQCLLLRKGWRENICKCPHCYQLYIVNNLTFLLEEEDERETEFGSVCRRYNHDCDIIYTSLRLGGKEPMASATL
ncbi:hypothetical protein MXB_2965, partial [Myxobolus squamalis]